MRAIAVLAVIVFHAFPRSLPGGFTGVDVFFVISGFLISSIILTGLERRTFTFRDFYARRVARIFPALVVVLAASLVAGWLMMLATEYRQLGRHVAFSGAFAANVVFWRETYFDGLAGLKPLLHLWSLGVEEQFYLVWPLLLWLAARRRLGVPVVIGTLAVLSFATNIATTHVHQNAAFYLPFGRLWELLLGALLAQGALRRRDPVAHPDPVSLVGLSFIVGGFLTAQAPAFPGWWALLPTLGTVMLIAAGPDAFINRHLLSRRALVFIGLISYPLYLWHWPALSFARHMVPQPGTALTVALVVASGLLAWITYVTIERPLRFRPGSLARFRTPALASAMVVVTSAGLVVSRNAIPPMLDARFRLLSNYAYDHEAAYRGTRCHLSDDQTERDFESSCVDVGFGDPRRTGMLLWGDSHAAHLYPGLRSLAAEQQLSLAQFTVNTCTPLVGGQSEFCARIATFVLDRVSRLEPDVVVMASRWQEDHLERVQRTVAELRLRGVKQVILVGPLPNWGSPLPKLLVQYMRAHPGSPQPERMRLNLNVPRAVEGWLRAGIGSARAQYVSAIDVFCRDDGCLATLDGQPTSWDTAHLTDAASRLLARAVISVLDSAGGP